MTRQPLKKTIAEVQLRDGRRCQRPISICITRRTMGDDQILFTKPLDAQNAVTSNPNIPSVSASAVLGESESMPDDHPICKGHDFEASRSIDGIMDSMLTTGFQATNLGKAVNEIKRMRRWRLSDTEWKEGDDEALRDPDLRKRIRSRIFFAYTSNQISCGQREVIKFIVKNKMVDVIVTTAGGIEEDIIKCFEHTYMGDFKLKGKELRKKGINRIGELMSSHVKVLNAKCENLEQRS